MSRITVIQGHPDPVGGHFCHALAEAYAAGAVAGGHGLRTIAVAELDFPLLRSQVEYRTGPLPVGLEHAQVDLLWADHYLIVYPLWAGTMPALLYRWYFRAHGLKNLERSVLGFVGVKPVRSTLIGLIDNIDAQKRAQWLRKVEMLGRRAR